MTTNQSTGVFGVIESKHGPLSLTPAAAGEISEVCIDAENGLVFRMPRRHEGFLGQAIISSTVFGVELLARLNEHSVPPPLPIPEHIDVAYDDTRENQVYACQTLVPGITLSREYIKKHFSPEEKTELGRSVAACAIWMADTMRVEQCRLIGEDGQLPSPHLKQLDRLQMVRQAHESPEGWPGLSNYPSLRAAIGMLKAEADRNPGLADRHMVGHRDLHAGNLLFEENASGQWAMSGWLDFDMAGPSNLGYELRFLPAIGREAVAAAVDYCNARDFLVTEEDVHSNVALHHVGSSLWSLASNGFVGPLARGALPSFFPDLDWRELETSFPANS